ncbi:MAG TPA: CHAP domain-containing protein [Ktedonobacteraceae bacterium]|nr:CHAP domain-containing protein [Ktedonobacteraceae bacterium]
MQLHQRVYDYIKKLNVKKFVGKGTVVAAVGIVSAGAVLGLNVTGVQAASSCSAGDQAYTVVQNDTLGQIASQHGVTWESLASHNHLANANLIYIDQTICIPGSGSGSGGSNNSQSSVATQAYVQNTSNNVGRGNGFPYGQCTWWAAERYHQIHGSYIPWNGDAGMWAGGAAQSGWSVSGTPRVGDIMVLAPGVQGAFYAGHVGVVEQVLGNGDVIASSMNWGNNPGAVTYSQFSPGYGVSFVHQ